ncbi:MAG: phosphotransferase family protein [Paracoccaceae bacterium]|jgi:aminoglycoside phosphotransferase (APT) family kinase protein
MSDGLYQFNRKELETYLQSHIDGFGDLQEMTKFSDGQSNPTYKLVSSTGDYVLRAKPPGKLLGSAHQVDREFRVMQALAVTKVPVPEMFHLSGDDSPLGAMFFVMKFVGGRILWDPALPKATVSERRQYFDVMNTALADLHDVDIAAVGLSDFGRPGNYFVRQTGRWIKQYRASEMGANADIERIMDWLNDHMVDDDGRISLVHGDYRIDNMIFDAERPEIRAILDWELSTLGHGLADLAYQCMYWRLPSAPGISGLAGLDRKALGIPSEEEFLERYCERRSLPRIENWDFYIIFSAFRLISIVQGVLKRSEDGNASNPQAKARMAAAREQLILLAINLIIGIVSR